MMHIKVEEGICFTHGLNRTHIYETVRLYKYTLVCVVDSLNICCVYSI